MFSKILIANRGEIAVRIIRACREMGISTVAVFSEADRDALHVSLADESYCIGGALSSSSYLNMTAIISVALATGAEAIHPGYGFLAENPAFAALCAEHGIVFIGPPPDVISAMGDKDEARRRMREAGLPVIPGSDIVKDVAEAERIACQIGYPLLIKARAGGGGRGIRLVRSSDGLEHQFEAASAEAVSCFGDGGLYLEKFLKPVKHIEMQILADNYGRVVCLGERDCSMQRRNQKLIEESPAPGLPDSVRATMTDASIKAALAVGYRGAGTIEYLCDSLGNFYFMEMNTRLQVEHPVSEMVTSVDIVKWQIRIASGIPLDFDSSDIKLRGHSIECRINSEDATRNFAPSCGKIIMLHIPGGPQVRFDTAIYQGYCVPPFYDSMIGKLIVCAASRDEAIRKMKAALCELIIEGIACNIDLHTSILSSPEFVDGSYTTDTLTTLAEKTGREAV